MEFATLFWVGMGFGAVVLVLHYLTSVQVDYGPMRYQRWHAAFKARYVMSHSDPRAATKSAPENAPDRPLSPMKRNGETAGNGVAIGETAGNDPFLFPDVFTGLARLVLDKKIGETDAIKIAIQATPGKSEKYQEARRRLHLAMEQEQPPAVAYRELTPDHQAQMN